MSEHEIVHVEWYTRIHANGRPPYENAPVVDGVARAEEHVFATEEEAVTFSKLHSPLPGTVFKRIRHGVRL